jgi:hypothetical protein
MRTLSSFKSEIAIYRRVIAQLPLDAVYAGKRWQYEFKMKVLDRLERHMTEKTWNKIETNLSVPCANFIDAVIEYAWLAEGLARIHQEGPDVEDQVHALTKRFQNAKSGEVDEQQLGDAIKALGKFRIESKQVLGREKTGPRERFMTNMRAWFEDVCGKPRDDIVAVLTNIVFDLQPPPGKGDSPLPPERIQVSGEAVRSAARHARTRAGRTP